MVTRKRFLAIALPLVLLLFSGYFNVSRAQSDSTLLLDANQTRWSHLVYGAKSVWVDVKVDVRLEPQSKSKMQAELLENHRQFCSDPFHLAIVRRLICAPPVLFHQHLFTGYLQDAAVGDFKQIDTAQKC